MIEPTGEMLYAAMDHIRDRPDQIRAGLDAVLAIVERDYDVTPRHCQWCANLPGEPYTSTFCQWHDCRSCAGQCKRCHAPCVCSCHAIAPNPAGPGGAE